MIFSLTNLKNELLLRVSNTDKAAALSELLPEEKDFGGESIRVTVIPANKTLTKAELLGEALKGNPNFSRMMTVRIGSTNSYNYAIFKKRVAQYWNDNLGDPHGNVSCLYQDLAKEVFGDVGGVMYCTDNVDDFYEVLDDHIDVEFP